MAGADGIDVVLLHGDDILQDLVLLGHAACPGAELMAVDALEHNPLSVEAHDLVDHLKPAEAYIFGDHFRQPSVFVVYLEQQLIEIGFLRAPQVKTGYRQRQVCFPFLQVQCAGSEYRNCSGSFCGIGQGRRIHSGKPAQLCFCPAGSAAKGIDDQFPCLIAVIQKGADLQIPDVGLRPGKEIYIPINAREAEEILILGPTAACPLVDLHGQFVFGIPDIGG